MAARRICHTCIPRLTTANIMHYFCLITEVINDRLQSRLVWRLGKGMKGLNSTNLNIPLRGKRPPVFSNGGIQSLLVSMLNDILMVTYIGKGAGSQACLPPLLQIHNHDSRIEIGSICINPQFVVVVNSGRCRGKANAKINHCQTSFPAKSCSQSSARLP